mmetsp:Transcript_13/g.34  ORF Transcript_13/g.34 Transcript_13/m.34 type:complete len:242 (-) Transcript_13:149-874(-)
MNQCFDKGRWRLVEVILGPRPENISQLSDERILQRSIGCRARRFRQEFRIHILVRRIIYLGSVIGVQIVGHGLPFHGRVSFARYEKVRILFGMLLGLIFSMVHAFVQERILFLIALPWQGRQQDGVDPAMGGCSCCVLLTCILGVCVCVYVWARDFCCDKVLELGPVAALVLRVRAVHITFTFTMMSISMNITITITLMLQKHGGGALDHSLDAILRTTGLGVLAVLNLALQCLGAVPAPL